MTSFWSRFNFRIKHQLYFRILPVVGLSVLAVGAFSGRLLTSRAVRTYVEQESVESQGALAGALERLSVQGLLAEVEGHDLLQAMQQAIDPEEHRRLAAAHLQQLLRRDGVRGAAFVSVAPSGRARFVSCALDTDLALPANEAALAAWVDTAWSGLARAGWLDLVTQSGWEGGPRMLNVDPGHALWVFDPVALAARGDPGRVTLLLPATVQEQPLFAPAGPASRHRGRMQTVLMVDVEFLLAGWLDGGAAPDARGGAPALQAVVDPRGRLICASVDSLAPGTDLVAPGPGIFRDVRGEEFAAVLAREAVDGIVHETLGSRFNPRAFLVARRAELPLAVVTSLEMSQVNGGLVLYSAIIGLMVTIALLGSILAITSVGERLSNRLQAMSHNMEEVAKGDFSRRMGLGTEDEVGQLISYFNQMTADLDEAHRQISEKTQNLRAALEKARRLDKAKDDFLALISHEVRTPLTSIIGGIDYMRVVLPSGDTEHGKLLEQLGVTEIVDIVESSGQRLSEFMNDAILMASLQSSDIRAHLDPVPIGDLCGVVLSSLQEGIAKAGLQVENALDEGASWAPLCDRELLTVALQKLLQNAVQHNVAQGRIRVREVETVPGLGPAAEAVEPKTRSDFLQQPNLARWARDGVRWRAIELFNTGPYIPKDKRDALFGKFELVGRIEHHQKGSGLSLPIVQAILENHGGKVHVESVEGDGNYFYLVLPTVTAASGDEAGQGRGGVAGDEEVGLPGDAPGLEAELQHLRA